MPNIDVVIKANYAEEVQYHTITVTQGADGTVTPGTTTVANGGSQTFVVTPNSGYNVGSVKVDGNPVELTTVTSETGTTHTSTFTNDDVFTINGSDYSISNGELGISGWQDSTNVVMIQVSGDGTLSFDYRVSSEINCDKMRISLITRESGESVLVEISGEQSGSYTKDVSRGLVIKVEYIKDGSVAVGEDCGYISNLKLIKKDVMHTYTFTNVTTDHTLDVQFVPYNVVITYMDTYWNESSPVVVSVTAGAPVVLMQTCPDHWEIGDAEFDGWYLANAGWDSRCYTYVADGDAMFYPRWVCDCCSNDYTRCPCSITDNICDQHGAI